MLSDDEIKRIRELINQGYKDYKIGKILGHSPNTISNYRKEINKTKVNQKPGEVVHYENPIPKLQHIVGEIDSIISSQKMQTGDQKEWQRRIESLQEILQEHNEWISEATDKTVKRRDEQWQYLIGQEYVKKDVVEDLKKRIKELETTIINLRNENEVKDDLITKNQQDISWINATNERAKETLNNRIRNLLWQKVGLEEKIGDLNDYIGNFLDDAGRWEQENLRHEKTDFDRHVQIKQSELDSIYFETEKKVNAVEKREEKVAKQEENIKKQQQGLDTIRKRISEIINNIEKWQEDIDNQRENIKKRWKPVLKTAEEQRIEGQRLQKWQTNLEKTGGFNKFSLPCPYCGKPKFFDATDQEINQKISNALRSDMHPECRIKSEKQKHIILRPLSISGEPVLQSGFSPIIRSGGEPMVIMSGLEPVVQSGFPSIIQSGEETKVVESSGGNMIQSGYSPIYYFGTKNLDKTSKKAGKVSS